MRDRDDNSGCSSGSGTADGSSEDVERSTNKRRPPHGADRPVSGAGNRGDERQNRQDQHRRGDDEVTPRICNDVLQEPGEYRCREQGYAD